MAGERDERGEGEPLPGLSSVPPLVRLAAGAWYRGATRGVGLGLGEVRRVPPPERAVD